MIASEDHDSAASGKVEGGDDLAADLQRAIADKSTEAVESLIADERPSEIARAFLRLDADERTELLELVAPETAAQVLETLPDESAAAAIEELDADDAAEILEELDSDDRADIIGELDDEDADAILERMDSEDAAEVRSLLFYEPETAGGLMMTEVFQFSASSTVGGVLARLSRPDEDFERYRGQHPYIVSEGGELLGVASLRALLTTDRTSTLGTIMQPAISVKPSASLMEVRDVFDENPFLGLPVTDDRGVLVGVVAREALADAELERAEAEVQKLQGVVSEELRSMPTLLRARRRLSWLTVNIGLNILAASVIAAYESTLAAVIALAVFLPIVSDMSGCSGNQAVAVSLRELSLGVARQADIFRVWAKEITIGVINGVALGVLIAIAAWLWKGNPYIGLVVGLALAINTVIAVSIGGTVPLLLKRWNVDPAVASGPMLTTITDMCGFFLVLSLATMMMPLLVR